MKRFLTILAAGALFATTGVQAAAPKAVSLDQLLDMVRKAQSAESEANKQREAQFRQARDQQAALLRSVQGELAALEAEGERLKGQFDANEKELAVLEEQKNARVGNLGEMFGVVRERAGNAAAAINRSYVSAQFPGREKFLENMAQSKALPKIEDLRKLWLEMTNEMTQQGKVVRFTAPVVLGNGSTEEREVVRVGAFNLLSNGEYLIYSGETKQITELARQPSGRFLDTVAPYLDTSSGYAPLFVDPSRGPLLSVVVQEPTLQERLNQGGAVGYVIMVILVVGLLIVLWRAAALWSVGAKISAQVKNPTPGNNPLGRIMAVYQANKSADVENLELKLDEAIMKEVPKLETGIGIIKVFAALAPLLGLLGTVTGMIEVFQKITMFGAGDPKLMAGGISTALVTTVQGIVTAIPLVFLHSLLAAKSKSLVQVLEEQSVGLVAQHNEK